ncbi:hypothetical protein [Microbacterium sp. NPDC058389]|uniref:hypothetical protein n=1 Tax=Microbacterium sp. NPDC058389 TaxID=3346475 RepID=UPI0036462E66
MLKRRREEVLTTAGVIAAVVLLLVGLAVAGLCATLLVQMVIDSIGPLDTVGIARPTPAWIAIIGLGIGVFAGIGFVVDNGGYLIRAARGVLPRPAGDERARREQARRKASQRLRREARR